MEGISEITKQELSNVIGVPTKEIRLFLKPTHHGLKHVQAHE